jgi:hypothetical protein
MIPAQHPARAIDEGVLIARSALTLMAKNHLIVGTLRRDESLASLDLPGFVRDELSRLADEQSASAERMEVEEGAAAQAFGALRHQHDYRPADLQTLRQRADIYRALAAELLRLRDDAEFVSSVAEDARADAWSEIGAVLDARLDMLAAISAEADTRAARMRAVQRDVGNLDHRFLGWQTD